jgi:hypothetical protein
MRVHEGNKVMKQVTFSLLAVLATHVLVALAPVESARAQDRRRVLELSRSLDAAAFSLRAAVEREASTYRPIEQQALRSVQRLSLRAGDLFREIRLSGGVVNRPVLNLYNNVLSLQRQAEDLIFQARFSRRVDLALRDVQVLSRKLGEVL